jgi:hypothetical protein
MRLAGSGANPRVHHRSGRDSQTAQPWLAVSSAAEDARGRDPVPWIPCWPMIQPLQSSVDPDHGPAVRWRWPRSSCQRAARTGRFLSVVIRDVAS